MTWTEHELMSINSFKVLCLNEDDRTVGEEMDWASLSYGFFRAHWHTPERAYEMSTYVRYEMGYWSGGGED
jgi:hypothetical protein